MVLNRIGPLSAAKMVAVLYAIFGLIMGAFFSIAALFRPDGGGGYIGLELGTVYATLGSRVTLVEMTDGLLPGVDRDLVQPLQRRIEKLFAAIHLGTKVAALRDTGGGVEADLAG